jgi:hypothetical protein
MAGGTTMVSAPHRGVRRDDRLARAVAGVAAAVVGVGGLGDLEDQPGRGGQAGGAGTSRPALSRTITSQWTTM